MQSDLAYAYASVDWADAQLPALEKRIQEWVDLNIHVSIEESDGNPSHNLVLLVEKESLPLSFNVEIGAYLNCLRSALDILATALARRYSIPRPDKAYFPVADSAAIFASKKGFKGDAFVNNLPAIERAKIEAIKPYQGGDDLIFALHHSDIIRKHQRLLSVRALPTTIIASAWKSAPSFTLQQPFVAGHDRETIIGFVGKGAHEDKITARAHIAFDESVFASERSAIGVLKIISKKVRGIIATFDNS